MWQLQEAKSKFSQLVDMAVLQPQVVSRRGKEIVVVLSMAEYTRLTQPKQLLMDVLLAAPKADLEVTRQIDPVRAVEF